MNSPFIDDGITDDRAIRDAVVGCKCSAEILYYQIPKTEWTAAEIKKQVGDSTAWYRKYCIDLTFTEFKVDPALEKQMEKDGHPSIKSVADDYHDIVSRLPKGPGGKEADYNDAERRVLEIYKHILELQKLARKADEKAHHGKTSLPEPDDVITVLFLDEWYNNTSEGGQGLRPFRVTANSQTALLIGMTRFDRESQNMLTHELTHALRKRGHNDNKKCFDQFVKTNHVTDKRPVDWEEHYSKKNADQAMNNPSRENNPFLQVNLDNDRVFSVREYLSVVHAGYVKCGAPCDLQTPKTLGSGG